MTNRQDRLKPEIMVCLNNQTYENGTLLSSGDLPAGQDALNWIENRFQIRTNRNFRVILVEDLLDYKVFIQTPNGKSAGDFNVWYAFFENGRISDIGLPKHDYMFAWYKRIKQNEGRILHAVEMLIKYREAPEKIVLKFDSRIREDLLKFLATLKWICLQEDVNYPPPYNMGSNYTLAAYVLLDYGFEPSEIRKLLRFSSQQ